MDWHSAGITFFFVLDQMDKVLSHCRGVTVVL